MKRLLESLVGRTAEIVAIEELLGTGAAVVTLTGPPGVGKTRIALELASRAQRSVAFVDVGEIAAAPQLVSSIATGLDLSLGSAGLEEALDRLNDALRGRAPLLLVLDGCEQLSDASRALVGTLSRDDVAVLATSEAPIGLESERVIAVAPLDTEAPGVSHAMALFLERGRRVWPAFDSESAHDADVRAIVRRLDGLPLAIELAASRLDVLGPRELSEFLSQRRDARTSTNAPAETDALQAALDASWERLEVAQQRALARCSVFRGGFDLAAASYVLEPLGHVPDLLAALARRSLLRVGETGGQASMRRYDLLQSVRDYGDEHIDELGDRDDAVERHARHYEAAASELNERVNGPHEASARASLEREHANLLAARRRMLPLGDASSLELALRTTQHIAPIYIARGPASRYVELADEVLDASSDVHVSARARARVFLARARLHRVSGAVSLARSDLQHALELARGASLPIELGWAHNGLGLIGLREGLIDDARSDFEAAQRTFESAGRQDLAAFALGNLASLEIVADRLDAAVDTAKRALASYQQTGDRRNEALVRIDLGDAELLRRRWTAARLYYETALRGLRELGNDRQQAHALSRLGLCLLEEGRLDEAEATLRSSVERAEAVGDLPRIAIARSGLARVSAARGHHDAAMANIDEAERIVARAGDRAAPSTVSLTRGFCTAQMARDADRAGDVQGAAAYRELTDASLVGAALGPAPSVDTLYAFGALVSVASEAPAGRPSAGRMIEIDLEGRWFRTPSGARVDLRTRRKLALVVASLLRQRLRASPGSAVSVDRLVAEVWPGERLLSTAAASRVHVAISTLRKLGLTDVIVRKDDGYALEASAHIVARQSSGP